MKIVLVIPTYNEAENIGKLIPILNEEFKKSPQHNYEVLVVDDNSPDGTADVVRGFQDKYSFVHLSLGKKEGLGAAYIRGFKYALKNLNPDVVIEMDADFQHDPKDVKRFVKEIENGNDYVIGSRFVEGGSIPKEWALYRKILSVGGSLFSKVVLGIFDIKDFTTGFRAVRVKGFLDGFDFDSIISLGFAHKIEFLYRYSRMGAKIKEIPITFGMRGEGNSKMEKSNMMDSIKVVTILRFREMLTFLKVAVVGFIGFWVDSILANVLRVTLLGSAQASLVSGFVAMISNYALNNLWSFKDRKIVGVWENIYKFVLTVVLSYIPIIFRGWMVSAAVAKYGDTFWVFNLAFLAGILIGLIWNFIVYSKLIWKKDD